MDSAFVESIVYSAVAVFAILRSIQVPRLRLISLAFSLICLILASGAAVHAADESLWRETAQYRRYLVAGTIFFVTGIMGRWK